MTKFDEKAVIQRIIQVRTDIAGFRGKSKFAKALGLSPSTYNYYEQDRLAPVPILLKICEITGADLELLITGSSTEKRFSSVANREFLQKLDELLTNNPELAEPVLAFIELLCEKKGIEKEFHYKAQFDKAEKLYLWGLEIEERSGDVCNQGQIVRNLGKLAERRGRLSEARQYFGKAVKLLGGCKNAEHLIAAREDLKRVSEPLKSKTSPSPTK